MSNVPFVWHVLFFSHIIIFFPVPLFPYYHIIMILWTPQKQTPNFIVFSTAIVTWDLWPKFSLRIFLFVLYCVFKISELVPLNEILREKFWFLHFLKHRQTWWHWNFIAQQTELAGVPVSCSLLELASPLDDVFESPRLLSSV